MNWDKTLLVALAAFTFLASCNFGEPDITKKPTVTESNFEEIKELPGVDSYGFEIDNILVKEARVKRNESLYIILRSLDVTPETIYELQQKSKGKFNSSRIRQNQKYLTYHDADTGTPKRMVFHQSATDYVVFDWEKDIEVSLGQKEVRKEVAVASGTIESSLYETLVSQGVNMLVANRLSEIFGWEIDFFRIYKGDKFKVVYEKQFVGDKRYGIGQILAAEFEHRGQTYDAYFYDNGEIFGYFDSEGNSLQKALLKAPFKYSQRISSNFSYNRFHPVLKKRMPHYGVDYAAPKGTPVISVGDGEIIEARYRGANGNIVKIRHNSTYTTAYLHLNGFAKGIKPGTRVRQGQVIGYVGRTGRVTGVHLDYRVYKHGSPVNPTKLKLPPSKGISAEEMDTYKNSIADLQKELEALTEPPILAEVQ
ncbi:peptidoglycan DD-metalloendopeptidase family protein [Balneola vulgaris]|uniref:peptidoglycan DD-metalloendopeptidase family protein n=1 Tax=Balneola vulgaris TaxID=287535 RepID=UPI00038298A6|nr:peptidoglycan DD-metalloendopeptidase family protein [Balneola vulgaris]